MAKRNGMRLRKISAIIIQAEIMKMRSQFGDAEKMLNEVMAEALSFGYSMKSSRAANLLSTIK